MYSPRIREEHIPALYRLAKSRNISMTVLVDEALSALLARPEAKAAIAAVAIPPKPTAVPYNTATHKRQEDKTPKSSIRQRQQQH